MVERRGCRIESNLCPENQLCVPTMTIKGESFRLKEKLKAGLLKPKIGEPPVTT